MGNEPSLKVELAFIGRVGDRFFAMEVNLRILDGREGRK